MLSRLVKSISSTSFDIKAELRERGLKVSGGNKQLLLSRLADSIISGGTYREMRASGPRRRS